jgi:hypothetical protein
MKPIAEMAFWPQSAPGLSFVQPVKSFQKLKKTFFSLFLGFVLITTHSNSSAMNALALNAKEKFCILIFLKNQ